MILFDKTANAVDISVRFNSENFTFYLIFFFLMHNNNQYSYEITGHLRIIDNLKRALAQNRFPHALLFSGPDGVGKKLLARKLSYELLGKNRSLNEKKIIHDRIINNTHQDFIQVNLNWGTKKPGRNIKIEAIRNLENRIRTGPFESESLVIIIDPAELMTSGASNALLKTLEEPPAGTYIFLITQSPDRLLQTIRSRCQFFRFSPLNSDELLTVLKSKGFNLSEDEINTIIPLSAGSAGNAIKFLQSDNFKMILSYSDTFLNSVLNGTMANILQTAELLKTLEKEDLTEILSIIELKLLSLLETKKYKGSVRNFDTQKWIDSLKTAKIDLLMNVNTQLLIEHLLWKLRKS